MSKFLLETYDALCEIALWLLFACAAVAGYFVAGLGGAIGFVVAAFVVSVFLVAPFMMISDIRKSVSRIEAQRVQQTPSPFNEGQPVGDRAPSPYPRASGFTSKAPGHIKNYKGYELARGEGGVHVDGKVFANVLEAEKWVNEMK